MLKRIEVRNFKAFKHLDFKCCGLNLLMGLNGAGKSSFVQLLMFLRSISGRTAEPSLKLPMKSIGDGFAKLADLKYCYAKDDSNVEFTVDFTASEHLRHDIIRYELGTIEGSVSRVIKFDDQRNSILIEWPAKIENELEFQKFYEFRKGWYTGEDGKLDMVSFLNSHKDDPVLKEKRSAMNVANEDRLRQASEHEGEVAVAYDGIWDNVKYVSSYRERPQNVYRNSRLDIAAMEMDRKIAVRPDGTDIAEFLGEFGDGIPIGYFECLGATQNSILLHPSSTEGDGRQPVDRSAKTLNNQVRLWLNEVSPGARLFIDKVPVGDDFRYVMSVGYGEDNESLRKFKPQNVGFGISYVLPVLVTLLLAQPETVIVIENPEAHLHPKGQVAMGNLIARAVAVGAQVFVETHSDHVVNGIRAAVKDGIVKPGDVNFAFFERKEHEVMSDDGSVHSEIYSEVRNIKVDARGSLSEYPADFMDEWNNQLMELL